MKKNERLSFQVKQYKPIANGFEMSCFPARHRRIDVASRFAPLSRTKTMASVEKKLKNHSVTQLNWKFAPSMLQMQTKFM